jgi:hypothetical protein
MNNTTQKLTLSQETLRNLTQDQDQVLGTTLPVCPTGWDGMAANNGM